MQDEGNVKNKLLDKVALRGNGSWQKKKKWGKKRKIINKKRETKNVYRSRGNDV